LRVLNSNGHQVENGIVFLLKNNSASKTFSFWHLLLAEQKIYLYSIESDEARSIPIGNDVPIAITWSQDDSSLYYATIHFNSSDERYY
jgi:hypothetical protein